MKKLAAFRLEVRPSIRRGYTELEWIVVPSLGDPILGEKELIDDNHFKTLIREVVERSFEKLNRYLDQWEKVK